MLLAKLKTFYHFKTSIYILYYTILYKD